MWHKIRHKACNFRSVAFAAAVVLAATAYMASCSNIDCPLNNKVEAVYGFYDSSTGAGITIKDTISVIAGGTDSVIYNRGVNISKLSLPMSYARSVDTLVVKIMGENAASFDTILVSHTNEPHFESVDCSAVMFHIIKGVELVSSGRVAGLSRVDSVAVANPKVNYNAYENFKIYFTVP